MKEAVTIDEKLFEPDHPNLATRYNNLGHIGLADGNPARACALFRRAYAIFTKHFDDDHPNVRAITKTLRRHCGGVPAAGESA